MDRRTFLAKLQTLQRSAHDILADRGSVHSVDCEACTDCMFCERCKRSHGCNYMIDSTESTYCNHCAKVTNCHQSNHLFDCNRVISSQYLIMCNDCINCTYCFGCVGLVRQEFHILNKPYDRKTYFSIVKDLKAGLGIRI